MSLKKIHKKHNKTKKMFNKIKGGIGPGSFFSSISKFIKLTKDTNEELNFIYDLKKQIQSNNEKMKKDVDEYGVLYKKLFTRTQSLYSKIDNLTDIQSQCSKLYPNENTSDTSSFSIGDRFNSFFNQAKNTVQEETDKLKNEGTKYATSLANQIPFTNASELQTTIEGLKKQIISLNEEITQLKTEHEKEKIIISDAFKSPVNENNLMNDLYNKSSYESSTPSVIGEQSSNASQNLSANEQPVTEEAAITVEQPVTEEATVTIEQPVTVEQPVTEEAAVTVEEPITGEQPVTVEEPITGEAAVTVEEPVTEEAAVTVEEPVTVEATTKEEPTESEIKPIPYKSTYLKNQQNAGKIYTKKRKYKKSNKSKNKRNKKFYL
jgi:hypothetical protein